MSFTGSSIHDYKSIPISVISGIDAVTGGGDHFGAFYKVGQPGNWVTPPSGTPYFSDWKPARSSSSLNCYDFRSEGIGFDSQASDYADSCVSTVKDKTYGLWWTYISGTTASTKLLLRTVIYVPEGSSYSLEKVCDESSFFGVNGETGSRLSLTSSQYNINSIEELHSLVKQQKVCVTEDGKTFFWNEDRIYNESQARQATDAAWDSGTFNSLEEC